MFSTRRTERSTGRGPSRGALSTAAALALLASLGVLVVSGLPARWASGTPWLASALSSDLFVACGLTCIAGVGVLAIGISMLWRIGRSARLHRRPDSGVVLVEFILLLPILLSVSLMILQAALLMSGLFAVNYSAWAGARAAAVQIPTYVDASEPANYLPPDAEGEKYARIFRAAIWPLIPLGNGGTWVDVTVEDKDLVGQLRRFYSDYDRQAPSWLDQRLVRKLSYVWDNTRLRVEPPENGQTYGPNEEIRVRVEHAFYLSVPYAGWMIHQLSDDGVQLDTGPGDHGLLLRASASMVNWGRQDWVERETFN